MGTRVGAPADVACDGAVPSRSLEGRLRGCVEAHGDAVVPVADPVPVDHGVRGGRAVGRRAQYDRVRGGTPFDGGPLAAQRDVPRLVLAVLV